MSSALWNLLHDAGISSIKWEDSDALVTVDGEFLREIFPKAAHEFIIKLNDCELFEYQTHVDDIKMTTIPAEWREHPEIGSAIDTPDGVEVRCVKGTLRLKYASYSLFLNDKTPISFSDLRRALKKQWENF